ncbi:glycosyltransferase [Sphingomonas gei]|uniref:Glycosyltransferase n=1 Tax=Sphingomonas gei TaxID=1395960 RepID=A0A4S1X0E9_9SPHN|nr:glycosyltransferase [Sphingomonas gei]TGX48695.1 glycosyltransferase [Sphingomonas gei]
MTIQIAAIVLAFNEAKMLSLTLPAIKALVDQVIVVDMGSTDGSASLYARLLSGNDQVVSYAQCNLSQFGFAHARNHGAKFTTAPWLFSIDSDEWIDPGQAFALRREIAAERCDVLHVLRRNYAGEPGADIEIDQLRATGRFEEETQRRIYRNRHDVRWEGLIHEEICDRDGNTWQRASRSDLVLHHLAQFKSHSLAEEKNRLYAYMVLRAAIVPGYRYGTNPFWHSTFIRENVDYLIGQANAYAYGHRLPPYDRSAVERAIA